MVFQILRSGPERCQFTCRIYRAKAFHLIIQARSSGERLTTEYIPTPVENRSRASRSSCGKIYTPCLRPRTSSISATSVLQRNAISSTDLVSRRPVLCSLARPRFYDATVVVRAKSAVQAPADTAVRAVLSIADSAVPVVRQRP